MSKLIDCKTCSNQIAHNAKSCPSCGAKNKKPFYKRGWFIALVILVLIGAIGESSDDNSTTTDSAVSEVSEVSETNQTEVSTNKENDVIDTVDAKENEQILENIILTTLEKSYPDGPVKVEEDENLKMYTVYPFDGFVAGVTAMYATNSFTDDYYNVIESFEEMSKTIMDQAREYGITKKYAIAIQNDKNTDNVLMVFYDGTTISNSFKK